MFNLSDIMKSAWSSYKRDNSGRPFNRNRFALAMRSAWNDAKTMAWVLRRQAEDAARRVLEAPAVTAARDELISLQHKDFWTAADTVRFGALSHQIAA